MQTHARVVVIGGGVIGCSVLYHLAKKGWTELLLLERKTLTSGSSWHAAGGVHTLNGDPYVAKLQQYTIKLYAELEAESGQSCGLHLTGGIMAAGTQERFDWLKMTHARGRTLGMETELISAREAKALFPLMDESCFVGALFDPVEGHLDPSGVTYAYAKCAQKLGAKIALNTPVLELHACLNGDGWRVVTEQGVVQAEHVVNAGGLWAREVGRLVGLELPVLAMEHMYLLTETMPEVVAHQEETGKELVHCIDFEAELYMRQERDGMLLGTYEKKCRPWAEHTTPADFGHELLAPDIDRISPSLSAGFKRYPPYATAGIRQIINGPFTFAPDGNPLLGPVRGLPNYWVACGVMAGFSQGGGVGLVLADWMTEDDPGTDVWAMDVARFGPWATMAYTNAKVRENYARRFSIRFPNEELPAGRPLRTTPIYDRLRAEGAVFGDMWALEQALWFAGKGKKAHDIVSFRHSNDFESVKSECKNVRQGVGMIEISGFAKYEVTGPGAEKFLSFLMANRMPAEGKLVLSPMLNPRGKLIGDFTIAKTAPEHFFIFGSGTAEAYHMRWFEAHKPAAVSIRPLGGGLCGLALAGPRARELMAVLTRDSVSTRDFPFLSFRRLALGPVPGWVGRISYTGETGYEIWVESDYLTTLYDTIREAGEAFSLGLFGLRALNALRVEKSFGSWAREYRPVYSPYEAGLGRFVDLHKGPFIGSEAIGLEAARAAKEPRSEHQRLVTFEVAVEGADVIGDEPIWCDDKVIGRVTSGGYGHWVEKSLALGYIPAAYVSRGSEGHEGRAAGRPAFSIELSGTHHAARLRTVPAFDPSGARMRA